MRRLLVVLSALALLAVLGIWLLVRRSAPAEVPFTRAVRERLVNALSTNGRAEPIQWAPIRARRAGAVSRVLAARGDWVDKDQLLAEQDSSAAQLQLAAAESRVAQARAALEVLRKGGSPREQVEIENSLTAARAELSRAQNELATLERLAAKKAATLSEVTAARQAVERAQLEVAALERRKAALAPPADRVAAEARLKEAEAEAQAARLAIAESAIRSPMKGLLYQFDVRMGAYLNPGDMVGAVGQIDRMRVIVYVDEPELGRVQLGAPVRITWDALPGREWQGKVERPATQVVTLGTRQVGEVLCLIENTDRALAPGANVNAEIQAEVIDSALTIPKACVRREGGQTGVFTLTADQRLKWQAVRLGASNVTRVQVRDGLSEGDPVALPFDRPLKPGDRVRPLFR